MFRASLTALSLALGLCAAGPARAAPPEGQAAPTTALPVTSTPGFESAPPRRPNVRAALAVGALTMLVAGALGGTRTALGASDGDKSAGLLIASGGFALAPIFSHMIVGEHERAAQFATVPLLATVGATAYISRQPSAVYHGDMGTRTAFGILLGVGLLGAVLGLADTAMASERARDAERARPSRVLVAPSFDGQTAALTIGGAL